MLLDMVTCLHYLQYPAYLRLQLLNYKKCAILQISCSTMQIRNHNRTRICIFSFHLLLRLKRTTLRKPKQSFWDLKYSYVVRKERPPSPISSIFRTNDHHHFSSRLNCQMMKLLNKSFLLLFQGKRINLSFNENFSV